MNGTAKTVALAMALTLALGMCACAGRAAEGTNVEIVGRNEREGIVHLSPIITAEPTPDVTVEPTREPTPEPVATIAPGVEPYAWAGDEPELPALPSWSYVAQGLAYTDIAGFLERLWPGYQPERRGDGGYVREASAHGPFRETVTLDPGGPIRYAWGEWEGEPRMAPLSGSYEDCVREAKAIVDGWLDTDAYTKHPTPFDGGYDEDGKPMTAFVSHDIRWEQLLNGIPVVGATLSVSYTERGIRWMSMNMRMFAPREDAPAHQPLAFDQALYALNYARALRDDGSSCSVFSTDDTIYDVRLVYLALDRGGPVFHPAYEFQLMSSKKPGWYSHVYVDAETGALWNDHDGTIESPFVGRRGA